MEGCKIHGHFIEQPGASGGGRLQPCPYLSVGTTLDSKSVYGETYRSIRQREQRLRNRILAETEAERIEIEYECSFEQKMKDPTSEVHQFFASRPRGVELAPPLRLRDALRGGHSELYVMEAAADADHDIRYVDNNSM